MSLELQSVRDEQEKLRQENEKLATKLKRSAEGQLGAKVEFLQRILEGETDPGVLNLSQVERYAAAYERDGANGARAKLLEDEKELRTAVREALETTRQAQGISADGALSGLSTAVGSDAGSASTSPVEEGSVVSSIGAVETASSSPTTTGDGPP
ncbi:unnamed protein product, partial [Amoebophrya sp. A25]|eukprot:GSA25T00004657001.1